MKPNDLTTLVHLVGFLTGIVLYAMLGLMTLRSRHGVGFRGRPSGSDRIPLATAALGLIWNSGALIVYGLQDLGLSAPKPWLVAVAFSALGFLPAVVVHSAVQALRQFRGTRGLVIAAYALSTIAALLQLYAALAGDTLPYRPALLALTIGYAIVVAALATLTRGQPGWRRTLSAVALAAFADIFLKRVLTLVALIALATTLYIAVAARHVIPLAVRDYTDPRATSRAQRVSSTSTRVRERRGSLRSGS